MWKQLKAFNINKMGHKKGYCLQNVRLGFGLPAKYPSAKDDMLANKKAGTLHDISSIPKNVAVPVYVDTASKYEHIIAYDRGTYYSDGVKLTSTKGLKFFGWGEMCEGVRVVEYVKDVAPKPTPKSTNKYPLGLYVVNTKAGLHVRKTPKTGKIIKTYKNGTRFDTYEIKDNWARTPSGWCCLDYCKLVKKY